jgi:microcystin-dependent protein
MTAMPQLRDILNNTPADASDVDFNFQTIENHIASELINRDGSVAMVGALDLQGPAPSAPSHAVPKSYVDAQIVPVGTIWQFAGAAAPTGWAICDGAQKSTTDPAYAALFAVIGYKYGGSGANFNLPNMKGKMVVGVDSGDALFNDRGKTGGSKNAIVIAHSHTVASHVHASAAHVHSINHGHTASAAAAPDHKHWAADAIDTFFAHGREGAVTHGAGAGNTFADLHNLETAPAGAHNHAITVNAHAGNSGSTTPGNTGPAAPATDSVGSSGTNANLPPFVTVNYIVRIG